MRGTGSPKRQCARFGCTAVATATFTFDAIACTVWLDATFDDGARAGELCTRHARMLTPPRGWRIEDRRPGAATEDHVPAVAEPTSGPGDHGSAHATPLVPTPAEATPVDPVPVVADRAPGARAPGPVRQLAAGPSDVQLEAELRGLLDAHSPLLARAFRSSGTV